MSLSLSDLDYLLPEKLIAIHPKARRDESRLLTYDRKSSEIGHRGFFDLLDYLRPGDLLIRNEAKVNPVRVLWEKPSGGQAEIFFLRCDQDHQDHSLWTVLARGKNLKMDREYELGGSLRACFLESEEDGTRRVRVNQGRKQVEKEFWKIGKMPLPPYILNERKRRGEDLYSEEDPERYQTVFGKKPGAVAAPTAGLHFTEELLDRISEKGVDIRSIFLAVGWGTFQKLSEEILDSGKLHEEEVELSADLACEILERKRRGGRVVAIGTTVVRTLEYWARLSSSPEGFSGACDLFLQPPWEPKIVDALITNFHLPRSSLLALVGGFLGERGLERLKELYAEAIAKEYRFYSYGDAMLIT